MRIFVGIGTDHVTDVFEKVQSILSEYKPTKISLELSLDSTFAFALPAQMIVEMHSGGTKYGIEYFGRNPFILVKQWDGNAESCAG